MDDFKIFANHAHVFPDGIKERGSVAELRSLMDECGIEKAVCFTCFASQYARSSLPGDAVDWLCGEIKNDSRLVGFGTIDFDREDYEEQVRKIADCGFKGIKIHPAWQGLNVLDYRLCRVYSEAQKLGLFLSFHTGIHWHPIKDYDVLLFDELAFRYPELRFSMEHIGGYHFFRQALAVIANARRSSEGATVFAGWTTVAMRADGLPGYWSLSDEELRTVIAQTGSRLSVFGLDTPYQTADYIKTAIERIKNLDIPEEAKRGVLGENLARALGVSL